MKYDRTKPGRLDICDCCQQTVRVEDLRYQTRQWGQVAGSNYFTYSSYNASGWACDASDKGRTSIGPYAAQARVSVANDNTTTEMLGSQTWEGSGTYRSTSAVDVSSWTSFCVRSYIGAYHADAYQTLVIVYGYCDSAGANKQQVGTKTITGTKKIWWTGVPGDIVSPLSSATAYFYFGVTCENSAQDWFVDASDLEKNKTSPDYVFIPTTGVATEYASDIEKLGVAKVCRKCSERIHKTSGTYVIPEPYEEYEIPEDLQEP
jgi:hypothetical protein